MKVTRFAMTGLCLVATTLAVSGCARQGTWSGVFAVDLQGQARTCVAPATSPPDGQMVQAQVQVSNEGGWCGITANRGGAPFEAYLLVNRPQHGRVFAHRVGANTRIDYTPNTGFTGADSFAVRVIPGNAVIQGAVTVAR